MWEITIIVLLILLNGFFAMSEMAVVSSRRARLQQLAEERRRGAKTALSLNEHPASFLSTVQVGITLIGILAGAFGGATVAGKLSPVLAEVPALAPYADSIAMGLVVVAITFVSLIFGELVPKRIALLNAEAIASTVAQPMTVLARAAKPMVWVLGRASDAILYLLRLHGRTAAPITEEEVKALIQEGTQIGIFAPEEREMIDGVLRLADRNVRSIMTPRPDIIWIDPQDTLESIHKDLTDSGYSRFLVSNGDIDNILGIVNAKDLLARMLQGQPLNIRACLKTPLIVHDGTPILKLLELFKNSHQEMAVVVDEYGGLEGVVTMTDILESVAGALPEQGDIDEPSVVQRQDGSWLIDGMTPIDEVERTINMRDMREEDDTYHTLAGFVLAHLGHVPKAGETFTWHDLAFEVVDMDGRRVDKVMVMPATTGEAGE